LAGGVDDLAAAAHRHDVRVGRLSARHSDVYAVRLKPLDLRTILVSSSGLHHAGRNLAHGTGQCASSLVSAMPTFACKPP
jgi:hypothetical protein